VINPFFHTAQHCSVDYQRASKAGQNDQLDHLSLRMLLREKDLVECLSETCESERVVELKRDEE